MSRSEHCLSPDMKKTCGVGVSKPKPVVQDQLLLNDRPTLVRIVPREVKASEEEEWEVLSPYQKVRKIMREQEDL